MMVKLDTALIAECLKRSAPIEVRQELTVYRLLFEARAHLSNLATVDGSLFEIEQGLRGFLNTGIFKKTRKSIIM